MKINGYVRIEVLIEWQEGNRESLCLYSTIIGKYSAEYVNVTIDVTKEMKLRRTLTETGIEIYKLKS